MAETKRLTLKIGGMHCGGCASSIENFLRRIKGVVECKVDYSTGHGSVVYEAGRTSSEQILGGIIFREPSLFRAKVVEET